MTPPKSPKRRPCQEVSAACAPQLAGTPGGYVVGLANDQAPTEPNLRRWRRTAAPVIASQALAPPEGCLAAGGSLRRSVSSGRARPPIPPVQGFAVRKGTVSTPLKPGEVPSRSRTSSPGPGPRGVPVPPRAGASTLAQGPPPGGPVGEPTVPIRIKYAGLARWG